MKYYKENFCGEYDFRSNRHTDYTVELHLHEYGEILYCVSGTAQTVVRGKKVAVSQGEFIFIPPNFPHEYTCKGSETVCAVFSPDFTPYFTKLLTTKIPEVRPVDAGELAPVLQGLPLLKNDNVLLVSGYLNLLCAKLVKTLNFTQSTLYGNLLYYKVISYLSTHFTEDITLKELAKKFGYNEKYLSSALYSVSGINFRKLLSLYRVNHAKTLLSDRYDNKNISFIAFEAGFSSIQSFNRAFKELTGITPSEYVNRRKIKNK